MYKANFRTIHPFIMNKEQILNIRELDEQSDIYMLIKKMKEKVCDR